MQNFREANGYCYWNVALLEAVASLTFIGHVTPATILVTSDESSLETVRSAWARKVLRAPSSYVIVLVGESLLLYRLLLFLPLCLRFRFIHSFIHSLYKQRDCVCTVNWSDSLRPDSTERRQSRDSRGFPKKSLNWETTVGHIQRSEESGESRWRIREQEGP